MENDFWKKYSEALMEMIGKFEVNDELLSLYELTDSIGALYSYIKDGMIDKVVLKDIIETIGNIYHSIAILELQYNLPPSLYTNYIGNEIDEEAGKSVNLQDCHQDLVMSLSGLSSAIAADDLHHIQLQLNSLITIIFDVCMRFNINTLLPLKYSFNELFGDSNESDNDASSSFKSDYKKRSKLIKDKGYEEVMFEVIIDKRLKKPYKGIKLKAFGVNEKYLNGDIVVDFFRAMTRVDKIKKSDNYSINYGEKYRKYMTDNATKIWSGFLVEDSILSADDIKERQRVVNGTVSMGKEARPIIMNNKIKDLDSLIDYIHEKENK